MRLDCPNGHPAVVRNDPKTTGFLAMCDTCGWSAPKVKAEFERAQRDEERRRRELAEQTEEETEERAQVRQLEPAGSSSRRRND